MKGAGGTFLPWLVLPLGPRCRLGRRIGAECELARQLERGVADLAGFFLQGLDRQPPDRAGDADGAGNLAGEGAHAQGTAARLRVELGVVRTDAGAPRHADV